MSGKIRSMFRVLLHTMWVLIKWYRFRVFFLFCSISLHLYLLLMRNSWYAGFYSAIEHKSGIAFSIMTFLLLSLIIVCNDAIKNSIKLDCVLHARDIIPESNSSIPFSSADFAQRISEDMCNKAKNLIDFWDFVFCGLGTILVFIPRMFFIAKHSAWIVLVVFCMYSSFLFLFNSRFLRGMLQKNLYKHEDGEARLRKFLAIWINPRCVRPINLNFGELHRANTALKKYGFTKVFLEAIMQFYENIGLILPFALFYSLYHFGSISFAIFIQLINLWTQINYGVSLIGKSVTSYIDYDLVSQRLKNLQERNKAVESDSLQLKNFSLHVGSKTLLNNFSLELKFGEKINLVAANGTGKTQLMQAMQRTMFAQKRFSAQQNADNAIALPSDILWIPEQPQVPDDLLVNLVAKQSEFQKNCALLNVDSDLRYSQANAAKKWLQLAAYAMSFDFVVWDDPFWGLDCEKYLPEIIPHLKSVLFLSSKEITCDGVRVVHLQN